MSSDVQTTTSDPKAKTALYRNDLLQAALRVKGWNSAEIIRQTGLYGKTVGMLLAGDGGPTIQSLVRFAGALGVPMQRLFDFEGE